MRSIAGWEKAAEEGAEGHRRREHKAVIAAGPERPMGAEDQRRDEATLRSASEKYLKKTLRRYFPARPFESLRGGADGRFADSAPRRQTNGDDPRSPSAADQDKKRAIV
jgi:hypothetical protein